MKRITNLGFGWRLCAIEEVGMIGTLLELHDDVEKRGGVLVVVTLEDLVVLREDSSIVLFLQRTTTMKEKKGVRGDKRGWRRRDIPKIHTHDNLTLRGDLLHDIRLQTTQHVRRKHCVQLGDLFGFS